MRRFRLHLAIAGVLMGLFCSAAAGESTVTATVHLTITVLPYAEVWLDKTNLTITISGGSTTYGPVYVGGTILCNCPVMLFARIRAPSGAPGVWSADTMVARIGTPGIIQFGQLLRVIVWDIAPDYPGGTFDLKVSGRFATTISEVPTPGLGEVMLTVVPE